ncbi:MAG: hypothetical protein WA080_06005 [Sulfuricurvum sp.]
MVTQTSGIQSYLPTYTDTSAANLNANFRGLPVSFSYAANSTTLIMSVPAIGLNQSFTGATRADSQSLLTDWFKSSGQGAIEQFMKKLAAVSPIDPIAGNPSSLMSQSSTVSFNNGVSAVVEQTPSTNLANVSIIRANTAPLGTSYLATSQAGLESKLYSLPLAYSFSFSDNPGKKINIMLPISLSDTQGAKAVDVGLGISMNFPIQKNWVITPAYIYGVSASVDMGSVGQVETGSVTSAFKLNTPNGYAIMGNMVGYSQTTKRLYSGAYAFDPGIKNMVYKNGLIYGFNTNSFMPNSSWEVFATNTFFTGTELYLKTYNEYGFSYGLTKIHEESLGDADLAQKVIRQTVSKLRVGLTYLDGGSKTKGVQLNFGYSF